jgi:hypothetical protein
MMESDPERKPWYVDTVRVNGAGSNFVDWHAGNDDAE